MDATKCGRDENREVRNVIGSIAQLLAKQEQLVASLEDRITPVLREHHKENTERSKPCKELLSPAGKELDAHVERMELVNSKLDELIARCCL